MTATATNRAQRRQLARASRRAPKRLPRNPLAALAPLVVLENARPHDTGEQAGEHIVTRAALERLVDGSADTDDFDRVAMCINMCKIRALEIDATLADMLDRTQDAMGACKTPWAHARRATTATAVSVLMARAWPWCAMRLMPARPSSTPAARCKCARRATWWQTCCMATARRRG